MSFAKAASLGQLLTALRMFAVPHSRLSSKAALLSVYSPRMFAVPHSRLSSKAALLSVYQSSVNSLVIRAGVKLSLQLIRPNSCTTLCYFNN